MLRILISVLMIFCFMGQAQAVPPNNQPLPAEKAFEFSSYLSGNDKLILEWHLVPGYYLYKEKIHIKPIASNKVPLKQIQMPKGTTKTDEIFGTYEIYPGDFKIPVILDTAHPGVLNVTVSYQGCSSQGFCYPPQKRDVQMNTAQNAVVKQVVVTNETPSLSHEKYAESIFDESSDIIIIITFLGLGLLLAFTPCVLPMIPILSGIILGHKHLTTAKAFFLSLVYVLGMAITYAIAGMVVAIIGSRIQTVFQSTWAIVFISGLFVLLALSLFGFYELEMPSRWTRKLTALSNKQQGGTYLGVFLMGVLSSLIVSPCVSAPLVGVLTYIADSGDVILGFFSLLALGIGMGIPLLLVGVSAGKFLPKSGAWMESVKKVFGILLLGVAIFILSRIIPGPLALFLWACLLICTAFFMKVFTNVKGSIRKLGRGLGFILLIYGVILMVGSVLGNSDPLRPWENLPFGSKTEHANFVVIKSMEELDNELMKAKRDKKFVMLDFYADWCSSCIRIQHDVFANKDVQMILSNYVLLKADVTKDSDFDRALLKRFNVIAPPTIIFFNPDGQELTNERIVGEINTNEFLQNVRQLSLAQK